MTENAEDGPIELAPFDRKDPGAEPNSDEIDLEEAREVNPFQIIERGEDTVSRSGRVTFADFSPRVLPADTPDDEVPLPKGESAPEPAPSPESQQKQEQKKSDKTVPTPASRGAGKSESGSQTSSSSPKDG